ncbi:MAG TPA: sodium transporter [Gammaproteobacteria bacterium]|nr:sodium transporter [Gammaproteobacteria bacterium]
MTEFTLTAIDYVMISAYALVVIIIGLFFAGREHSAEQYFLAGRRMGWPLIGISLFASNISSTTLVGLSGNAYGQGIAVFNYEWMAAVVLVIIAAFFLPAYLRARVFTIPEYLERRYDRRSRYYFSALTLFLNIVVDTAGSLYAGGLVLQLIFPAVPLWQIIAALTLVAGIYTAAGGLAAVMYTDAMQAVLLTAGACIIAWAGWQRIDGWEAILAVTTPQQLSLILPADDPRMPWPGLLTGVFLIGFYFWGMNQFMVQRMLSARDLQQGQRGALFAGLLKLTVLFIMVMPGLMARVLYPELTNQDLVFPTLMFDLLPPGVLGLVLAGLLAALMSSIDSTLNSASTLVTMDFVHTRAPGISGRRLMWIGRGVTVLFMLLAMAWAPQIATFSSLFNYLQQVLAYAVSPVVAVLVIGMFWRRASAAGAFAALVAGLLGGVSLFVANVVLEWTQVHFLYIAPLLFVLSTVVLVAVSLRGAPVEGVEALMWRGGGRREQAPVSAGSWYGDFRVLSLALLLLTALVVGLFA